MGDDKHSSFIDVCYLAHSVNLANPLHKCLIYCRAPYLSGLLFLRIHMLKKPLPGIKSLPHLLLFFWKCLYLSLHCCYIIAFKWFVLLQYHLFSTKKCIQKLICYILFCPLKCWDLTSQFRTVFYVIISHCLSTFQMLGALLSFYECEGI